MPKSNDYEFTEYARSIADTFKNDFKKLPRETALAKYEKIKKSKGTSRYPHSMMDLFANCGLTDIPSPDKLKEKDVLMHLNLLPAKDELTQKLMIDLYTVYTEYKSPGQYMERLVNNLADDEFCADTTRMKILKQILKNLQKDGESVHPGVHSFIKDIKRSCSDIKNSKNISDVISKLNENIFLNINNVLPLDDFKKELFQKFYDKVIKNIDSDNLTEENLKLYNGIKSVIKKVSEKSFLTSGELSVIKSINNIVYTKDEELPILTQVSNKILNDSGFLKKTTDKQKSILLKVHKILEEIEFSEKRRVLCEFALMFKSVMSTEENQTELKPEQFILLEKTVNFINKNKERISLSDKKARIKIINEEFSLVHGNLCCEYLIEEIKVLINNLIPTNDLSEKDFLDSVSAFLTETINLNKEEMQIVDLLYSVCRKTELKGECQKVYNEFISVISKGNTNSDSGIKLTLASKELLKLSQDLATCTFRMNGATREALYLFAFAFGLRSYKAEDIGYSKYNDIEKFFWDCYNDSIFRYIELNDFVDNSSLPTGEGINYKNFAEVICLYFLSANDSKYSKYEKYKNAMECISNCKKKAVATKKSDSTYFYKTMYMEEVMAIESIKELEEFICSNFYIPTLKNSVPLAEAIRTTGITLEEIKSITDCDTLEDDSVRLAILKRFVEFGFVGDGPITGVTPFVNKAVENGFDGVKAKNEVLAKITDESLDRFKQLPIKDEHKLLARISNNLASGDFIKYSSAKENLFKFAFVFGMNLYKDTSNADYNENLDACILFEKFFADGINYEDKLDTICAYYLFNRDFAENKKHNLIQYRLKQAFNLYRSANTGAGEEKIIEDKKEYFWTTAVSMDEETFKNYVLTCFKSDNNVNINNFDALSDEFTAYNTYNEILKEFEADYQEQDIRSTVLDDIQVMREWFINNLKGVATEFSAVLYGIEKMVSSVKNITRKNITRNDIIILNYHKITEEIFYDRDLEYVYDYAIDYINYDLERCRFQLLDPKNFFDFFIICMLYMRSIDTPLF